MPTLSELLAANPNSEQPLRAMAESALVDLDGQIQWRPFAATISTLLGPLYKQSRGHLLNVRGKQRFTQAYAAEGFWFWCPAGQKFRLGADVTMIAKREMFPEDPDHVVATPYDVLHLSEVAEQYWVDFGISREAVQTILGDVLDGFLAPDQAGGGRFLAAALGCIRHLRGSTPTDPGRLDRLGSAARIARAIGVKLEAIPPNRRRVPGVDGGVGVKGAQLPADRTAHNDLRDAVREAHGDDFFLSEENRAEWQWIDGGRSAKRRTGNDWQPLAEGNYVWLVDPLDGSLMWLRGMQFAIGIALGVCVRNAEGELVIEWYGAVIYLPKTREMLLGLTGGGGLHLDYGQARVAPLRTTGERCMSRSTVATHLSGQWKYRALVNRFIDRQLPRMVKDTERLVALGCGLLAQALVARGGLDGYISCRSGGAWDYLPGAILVSVAGGDVCNFLGKPPGGAEQGILAAAHPDLLQNFFGAFDLCDYAESDFTATP